MPLRPRVARGSVILAFIAATVSAQAPPPPPANPPQSRDIAARPREGTARLRGAVVTPEGQPVKRATVTLSSGTPGDQPRSTTSDAGGRFSFELVPPGRFTLTAAKTGYVTTGLGAHRPGGSARPVEVADGADLGGANITLARGCAISGRITDEYGEPVSGVSLRVLKYRFTGGRRQLAATDTWFETTDDLGEFRAYGLPAGDYYLAAVLRPQMVFSDAGGSPGYAPTYYPGTPNVHEAARVPCQIGQEIAGIDFALNVAPTFTVSGFVRNSGGRPVTSGLVILAASDPALGPGGIGAVSSLQSDGRFTINEVVPGDYVIRTSTPAATPGETEIATAILTVSQSVSGLSLVTGKVGLLTGRVVADAGQSFGGALGAATVTPTPIDPSLSRAVSFTNPGRIKADGTFEIGGLHGSYVFRIAVPGWTLKAVRLGGTDVTDTPVTFRANADTSGLEVVLSNRLTSLGGTVVDADGQLLHDYAMLLFAQDPARWHWNSRFLLLGRPDQEGRFKLPSVPPGAYYLAAVREADPEEWTDPELLGRLKDRATKVVLAEGEAKTVELVLLPDGER